MQNLNEILQFNPENPEAFMPTLERVSDDDVRFASDISYREEIRARAMSVCELMKHGMQVESDDETHRIAADIAIEREPLEPHKTKPDVILHLEAIMNEFDHEVVNDAVRMRRVITNKLLFEASTAEKASERIKAMELLGKITEVGLFTERQHITIEQKSTEELEKELEETIQLLLNPDTNTYEAKKQESREQKPPKFKDIKINV